MVMSARFRKATRVAFPGFQERVAMSVSGKEMRVAVLRVIEQAGLGLITLATLVAIGQEVHSMVSARHVTLADILLLFIFLEVIAMVAIYFESHRLPVRFPIYIAIVALARYLILDSKTMGAWGMAAVGATIVLLTVGVLILRIGHVKFPYRE
jgi:protein PsiE